jgi:peroxiredoxin
MLRNLRLPGLLATVVLAFFISACTDGRRGVNPGDVAPDIAGVDPKGAPITLASIPAKAILINFWATWCAPCMAELPELQALHKRLEAKGFAVVGVAVDDDPDKVRAAVAEYGITYPIIIDSDAQSKRRYEVKGLPESYVLDSKRQVLLVVDPADGAPVTKIIGPRAWTENNSVQLFEGLLQ